MFFNTLITYENNYMYLYAIQIYTSFIYRYTVDVPSTGDPSHSHPPGEAKTPEPSEANAQVWVVLEQIPKRTWLVDGHTSNLERTRNINMHIVA